MKGQVSYRRTGLEAKDDRRYASWVVRGRRVKERERRWPDHA